MQSGTLIQENFGATCSNFYYIVPDKVLILKKQNWFKLFAGPSGNEVWDINKVKVYCTLKYFTG